MKQRCYDENCNNYTRYGGRGISVCDEWNNNYECFRNWSMQNGYKDNLSIDRINNNGNYEPNNCRWTTRKTQSNNRSSNRVVVYNGITKTVKQWSEDININYATLLSRFLRGWSIERALEQPVRKGGRNSNENNS